MIGRKCFAPSSLVHLICGVLGVSDRVSQVDRSGRDAPRRPSEGSPLALRLPFFPLSTPHAPTRATSKSPQRKRVTSWNCVPVNGKRSARHPWLGTVSPLSVRKAVQLAGRGARIFPSLGTKLSSNGAVSWVRSTWGLGTEVVWLMNCGEEKEEVEKREAEVDRVVALRI